MLPFALALNSHVVVVANCTNIKNARARRAKFLFLFFFFSLSMQFERFSLQLSPWLPVFREVVLACASQKTQNFYGTEKPFVKLRLTYSVRLVFSYVVKGIKIEITAKFCDTELFRFEDRKRTMSPEKFRVFRARGPLGPIHSDRSKTMRKIGRASCRERV